MPPPIRVTLAGFEKKRLEVVPSGLTGPQLLLNGQKLVADKKEYRIADDTDAQRIIRFRNVFPLDPIPILQVDGQDVHVARPLTAVEKTWLVIPFALIAVGGALGGLLGALAAMANSRVLRGSGSVPMQHLKCLGVTIGAAIIYVILASVVQMAFHDVATPGTSGEVR